MEKFFKTVWTWLIACRARARARKAQRKEAELEHDSRGAVQVMEFDGELYIGYHGEPVLPVDGLKWDLGTTLTAARGAFIEWHKKRHP